MSLDPISQLSLYIKYVCINLMRYQLCTIIVSSSAHLHYFVAHSRRQNSVPGTIGSVNNINSLVTISTTFGVGVRVQACTADRGNKFCCVYLPLLHMHLLTISLLLLAPEIYLWSIVWCQTAITTHLLWCGSGKPQASFDVSTAY